jgi:Holliday junction resolvase
MPSARSKGNKAEILLQQQLESSGYETRRTHLSAFPDIIAWNHTTVLFIEVKSISLRSNKTPIKPRINSALTKFRINARLLKAVYSGASLLCYVRFDNNWLTYQWINDKAVQVESIINEER